VLRVEVRVLGPLLEPLRPRALLEQVLDVLAVELLGAERLLLPLELAWRPAV